MKLRFLVPCLTLALMTIAARAQIGVYLNPVGIHVSNSTPDTGTFAFLGDNVTGRTFYGINFGGYDDLYHATKFDAGLDIRDSYTKGDNASLNSFLVGGRIVGRLVNSSFRPYAQISIGVGSTKPPHSTVHISRATYDVFAGLDYPIAKHVDFRVVEVGYGGLSTVSSANFNGTTSSFPSSRLFNVSTGLVFRFR
jgi:hypothetical protein